MNMQEYINDIKALNSPTFQKIKKIAKSNCGTSCPGIYACKPWNALKHGVDLLNTHEKLCKYLCAYGDMHEAKLRNAINHIPQAIFEHEFEIVDWGCGQGIGSICLLDHLNAKGSNNKVGKITLIEPSKEALERAKLHVESYNLGGIDIKTFAEYFQNIQKEDIISDAGLPVLHIFSNILDVKEIDLKDLAVKIDQTVVNDNYIISVGPLNFTNKRIDAFYNYYNAPILYDYENRQYEYGGNRPCTYKAKIYKLEYNEQGNLIPIEFYPSVQFHSSYQLDSVTYNFSDNGIESFTERLNVFDTSTPFDIGASVYDDIHPILAVVNNIVTRGLPTKASPFVEKVFQKTFDYSEDFEKYGTLSYPHKKDINTTRLLSWYNSVITNQTKLNYSSVDIEQLQLLFSPIAIARVQKTILEALMTDKLNIKQKEWKILVEEQDVPCSAIAIADLVQIFNKVTKLSKEYQDFNLPEIKLDIISSSNFRNSGLHLGKNVFENATPVHLKTEYDLVIDVAIFDTTNIEKESFSRFQCKNNCYFNIRSVTEILSERNIYTTDRIVYRDIVSQDGQGNYSDIDETKKLLEYFLQLIFRKKSFRPGQLPILNRALQNKSVIGLLPTGGGKSLTYQLASMLQPGVTLIVDPLRSLMKDQYDGLINVGIDTCAFVNSTLSKEERDEAERKMEQSKLLFVFLSPERLAIYKFREKLKNMHELNVYFSYGVIDEVHCVSEWGHDFRFSYLHLGRNLYNYVRAKKDEISLFGLTATASFDVLADVERELSGDGAFPLDSETIVRYENSNRLELQYKIEKVNVEFDDDPNYDKNKNIDSHLPRAVKISNKWGFFDAKQDFLKNYIKTIPNYIEEIQSDKAIQSIKNTFSERQGNSIGVDTELKTNISQNYFSKNKEYSQAGIIFCPHKNSTGISVYSNKEALQGLVPDVGTFSGGDDDDSSNSSMDNLELFRTNKQPIMVATKAFGMGIDKPNVRFTVNLNYSSSLESFVQEAGRGGRDRKMALSVILLSDYKLARISRKIQNGSFPLGLLKGRWFKPQDLQQIVNHYNLNIDEQYLDYLTPENDLVRIFCKEGSAEHGKFFDFLDCKDDKCRYFKKCPLKGIPKEAENWIYKDDLFEILNNHNISIDKKYIEYQNADYETVMYFYNNSFKGEVIEKQAMFQILSVKDVEIFFGDDAELKPDKSTTVRGFLTTLLESEEGQEIVSFIKYDDDNGTDIDQTDIAKAIYRMTCIGLIEDFTQDYSNNRYRIVSKRKEDGSYYKGLEQFLLRYYSVDRAHEEIETVYDIAVRSNSSLEKEIYQCLSYLTTFVYDKISVKRKRAIDDMRTFCITGATDIKDWKETNEELKDFIYYYFNSKYAKTDYIADNGEDYSITNDTEDGKVSKDWILFKYLKVIDDKIEQGTPIDNVKHLQGAVRLLRRSLTDSNPTLSLLNSFCIFFLGTNNNENLENEVIESYKEGMLGFAEREKELVDFWELFEKFNQILKPFSNNKLKELKAEITLKIHNNRLKKITSKYTV
ncbi:DEAD/DEAH box helicase [uncultured Draconibacterium sp.]|uniref:DEAD/DEAH box helicase n=1 Tax=uncultured Draconibacterium sp. TaxID=1573823 RepID=UPI0032611225